MFPELGVSSLWIYVVATALGGALAGLFGLLNMRTTKIFEEAGYAAQSNNSHRGSLKGLKNPLMK